MKIEFETRLKAVDQMILTPLVRNALEDDSAEVVDWNCQPLIGGMAQEYGLSYGLYRFKGTARTQGKTVSWSLILKATGGPSEFGSDIPSHCTYWKREVLVYQSGLLDDLPGNLVAPRCFGVIGYPGNEFWIWLEDISEETVTWSLESYGLAARHLGQFNGAYFVGRSLPDEPWLSTGRIREWLDFGEPTIRDLRNLSQHRLAQHWFRGDSVERILRLWEEREPLLEALDRLPRTLCHHDAFRRNLMVRAGSNGREETVAIDWAMVGTGVIGEEIATLVTTSLQFLEVDVSQTEALDAIVFEGYLDGLRDAGWRGDARLVRFGYAATAALYMGLGAVGVVLNAILDDDGKVVEKVLGYPIDYVLDQFAILQNHVLDLGDEARELLPT